VQMPAVTGERTRGSFGYGVVPNREGERAHVSTPVLKDLTIDWGTAL
jgi:hypothetical protein